jgi:hypothetical protein
MLLAQIATLFSLRLGKRLRRKGKRLRRKAKRTKSGRVAGGGGAPLEGAGKRKVT